MKVINNLGLLMLFYLIPELAQANSPAQNRSNANRHYQDRPWADRVRPQFYGNSRHSKHSSGHHDYNSFGSMLGAYAFENGIRQGELSRREVRELRNEQRDIFRQEKWMQADGVLTARERRDLLEEIRDYRRKLNHELNDGEKAW